MVTMKWRPEIQKESEQNWVQTAATSKEGDPIFFLFFLVRVHRNILNIKSEYYFNRVI